MGLWTSRIGLSVCVCIFGFFAGAMGPTYTELVMVIAGPKYFNFAHGFANPAMGLGWFLAPPTAGRSLSHIMNIIN